MMKRSLMALLLMLAPLPIAADWTVGFEGSSERGYGFVTYAHPILLGAGERLLPWASASWLYADLGPEIGYQGNQDVTVTELGGIVEIPYGENWLYARAGQATEKHSGGREEKHPYFSVGIARSF